MSARRVAVGRLAVVASLVLCSSAIACAPSEPPASASASASLSGGPPIARVHARKCSVCHEPPEPGTRTRAHLEDAFKRHRKRVRLTPAQWRAMIDYLAAPDESRQVYEGPGEH